MKEIAEQITTLLSDIGFPSSLVDDVIEVPEADLCIHLRSHRIMPKEITTTHKLVTIWEDQILNQYSIVASRIRSLVGKTNSIYGRETKVGKIDKLELFKFLIDNHLNKPTNAKHKYGLYHGNELVSVASFSKSCPIEKDGRTYISHELVRFCNKKNTTVVGGLSKLIKHFVKEHNPEDLMTYADKEWSNGSSYQRLNFKLIGELQPRKFMICKQNKTRHLYKAELAECTDFVIIENQGSLKFAKTYV